MTEKQTRAVKKNGHGSTNALKNAGRHDREFKELTNAGWVFSNPQGIWRAKFSDERGELAFESKKITELLAVVLEEHRKHQKRGKKKSDGEGFAATENTAIAIEIRRIQPSPFETQARRRARFSDSEISALGESIGKHGLFSPILVRPVYPDFEIVFGERRFLACVSRNLPTIDCFIRNLTDAQVLELQYEENHRRQENAPLDDAFTFKFLMEKFGYSEDRLADRLNTSRRNVVDKLKLNDLIFEARRELESGSLPLKHAVYLAKFPAATQAEIVKAQYAYKYHDREERAAGFDQFRAEVEQNILRVLKNAAFDPEDARLHIKALKCGDCPERTGFETHLFPELADDDSCLNPGCFRLKTDVHLKLKRIEIAKRVAPHSIDESLHETVIKVPIVTSKSSAPERHPFEGEKVLTNQNLLSEPECPSSEISLEVGTGWQGEAVYICRDASCEIHHGSAPKTSDENELRRREEKFRREVKELTRAKVFKKSLEYFTDHVSFWQFDDLIKECLREMIQSCAVDTRKFVFKVIEDWRLVPTDCYDKAQLERFLDALDKRRQSQLLFLLTVKMEGFYSGTSQDGVKRIARDYAGTDYAKLEAEALIELAPNDQKAAFRHYLQTLETNPSLAVLPKFGAVENKKAEN